MITLELSITFYFIFLNKKILSCPLPTYISIVLLYVPSPATPTYSSLVRGGGRGCSKVCVWAVGGGASGAAGRAAGGAGRARAGGGAGALRRGAGAAARRRARAAAAGARAYTYV